MGEEVSWPRSLDSQAGVPVSLLSRGPANGGGGDARDPTLGLNWRAEKKNFKVRLPAISGQHPSHAFPSPHRQSRFSMDDHGILSEWSSAVRHCGCPSLPFACPGFRSGHSLGGAATVSRHHSQGIYPRMRRQRLSLPPHRVPESLKWSRFPSWHVPVWEAEGWRVGGGVRDLVGWLPGTSRRMAQLGSDITDMTLPPPGAPQQLSTYTWALSRTRRLNNRPASPPFFAHLTPLPGGNEMREVVSPTLLGAAAEVVVQSAAW